MIYIEPFGGLANRMRVIASGIWLKEKIGSELVVIWNEHSELNCSYDKLFENSNHFTVKRKRRFQYYLKSSINNKRMHFFNRLLGINFCLTDLDFYSHVFSGKIDLVKLAKEHKNIYIQTCQEFCNNIDYFKYLQPIPILIKKINLNVSKFNNHTIGVHIRRTDNLQSIEHSPLQLFIDRMQEEEYNNPETLFFLCTDDKTSEDLIVSKFNGRVIINTQIRDRLSIEGMQEALVDLFCLAKTEKIFGSYWSSFSEIAAKINNAPLFILKKNSGL